MNGLQVPSVDKQKIRLLLVDNQPAVRQGLKMRLTLESNLEVIGEAGDGVEAIRLALELRPDVTLMDVRMPGEDGISITRMLREALPHSAVVILSLYDDFQARKQAREAGAAAFVTKQRAEEVLLPTILRVAHRIDKGGAP